jgi:hypothetical protein
LKKIPDLKEFFFITAFFITKMFSAFVKQLNKKDNAQQKSKKITFFFWNWLKPTPALQANKDKSLYLPHREKEDHSSCVTGC